MKYTLEDIESYIDGKFDASKKRFFESALQNDNELAKDMAFYLQSKQAAKLFAQNQRKADFEALRQNMGRQTKIVSFGNISKIAAAACVLLFGTWLVFSSQSSTTEMAQNYVEQNLMSLNPEMSANDQPIDSLNLGKKLYEEKKYSEAIIVFQKMTPKSIDEVNFRIEYLGLSQLKAEQYDAAIGSFRTLAQRDILKNNGVFYEALTLLKRNQTNDKEQAEILLQKVIDQNLGHKTEAEDWLNSWNGILGNW